MSPFDPVLAPPRRVRTVLALLAVLAFAGPASAARVVQVRVGQHPEFTRVVFELDGPAGYQLEKRGAELRVTLDAASKPRTIRSRGEAVKQVRVESAADDAVATVQLHRSGLRVKEMILANPSRIVLDVMLPEPAVAPTPPPKPKPAPRAEAPKPSPPAPEAPGPERAPAPKPKPEPKPVAPKPQERAAVPAPKPVAQEPKPVQRAVAPKPEAPAPAPKPQERAIAPTPPAPKPAEPTQEPAGARAVAKAPVPGPGRDALPPRPVVEERPADRPAPTSPAETAAKKPARLPTPTTARTLDDETEGVEEPASAADALRARLARAAAAREDEVPGAASEAEAGEAAKPGTVSKPPAGVAPKPIPPKPARVAKPAPAPAAEAQDAAGGWMPGWVPAWVNDPIVWGGALAAFVVLALVLMLGMRRRRPLPNDLDVTAIAGQGDGVGEESSFTAGLFDSDEGEQEVSDLPAPSARRDAPAAAAAASAGGELDSLFDDMDEKPETAGMGDEAMNQGTSDLPADPGSTQRRAPSPPAAGAGTDPDVLRIVHELERRMGQLESKLAEANEARERLERQVAAQSEELRVQRAAIARTQRALRTMSRGDEDKATEPALRDGDTQVKTRVNL